MVVPARPTSTVDRAGFVARPSRVQSAVTLWLCGTARLPRSPRLVAVIVPLAIVLLVNAAFAVAVWPTFYKRVANDPRARDESGRPTTFLTVHRVIIG